MTFSLEGCDFSAHDPGTPGSAALRAAGKHFVCTYLSGASDWRVLSPAELRELEAGGIEIVANYEADTETWRGGFQTGVGHAQYAQQNLVRVGLPPTMPIYFSVDYDASPGDQTVIDDYLRGAASVIGLDRVGVYGGFYVVERCHDNGTATWLWQTSAWSGGQWYHANHLEQYAYSHNINGVDCDDTRAVQEIYGQASAFRNGGTTTTTTTPAPSPYPVKRVPAPDKIEAQGNPLTPNKPNRFLAIQGGHLKTGPSDDAPDATSTPYKANRSYTFDFSSTVNGETWLVSKAGSWAPMKNFKAA